MENSTGDKVTIAHNLQGLKVVSLTWVWEEIHHLFGGIWKARRWLIKRCRWRIGDGKTATLWKDSWMVGHSSLMLEDIHILEDRKMTV